MSFRSNALRRRRRGRTFLLLLATGLLLAVGCNTVTTRLVDREDKRAARNADGIMKGAEASEYGNASSPNAVLFVHGFAGAGTNFNQLPKQFAEAGWYVRVMRLPGHGTSPHDLENVSADALEKAVLDEVIELRKNRDRVVLVGHSMGGALCTLAAATADVDGLILGGAYFGVTYRWYYGLPPETWTKLSSHVFRWMYKGKLFTQVNDRSQLPNIVSYTWLPTKAGVTLNAMGNRVRRPEVLAKVSCPVLMFHSHGDIAASPETAETAFNAMASAKKELVWVDRSNHHVFWDFDSKLIAKRVAEFAAVDVGEEVRQQLRLIDPVPDANTPEGRYWELNIKTGPRQ